MGLFLKITIFHYWPQVGHHHWIQLVIFESYLLGNLRTFEINHKRYDWLVQVYIQLNLDCVTVISISREAEAIMHKQKLVRPVAITVVSLLSRLQRSSLKVDKTKMRFLIVHERIVPVKLFFSLTTHRCLFIFLPFDLWLQWLDLPVPVLISIKVSFLNRLVFRVPMVIVENFFLVLLFIHFVQYHSLSVYEKL